jgi:hypothetical protein
MGTRGRGVDRNARTKPQAATSTVWHAELTTSHSLVGRPTVAA